MFRFVVRLKRLLDHAAASSPGEDLGVTGQNTAGGSVEEYLHHEPTSSPGEDSGVTGQNAPGGSVEEYWTEHNVTLHKRFTDSASSLEYLHWRNSQYYGYAELMPTSVEDNLSILDFGCGPGNDLVGFGVMSKPCRLVGVDVSASSLTEAKVSRP